MANIDKAYCDEAKAVFLCLMQKKKSQIRLNLQLLAEMVGILPRAKQQPAGLIACYNGVGSEKFTASELYRCPNLSYNEDVLRERSIA